MNRKRMYWGVVKYLPCVLVGHTMVVTQELTPTARREACVKCGIMFAELLDQRLSLRWHSLFHKMYESHGIPIVYLPWEGVGK